VAAGVHSSSSCNNTLLAFRSLLAWRSCLLLPPAYQPGAALRGTDRHLFISKEQKLRLVYLVAGLVLAARRKALSSALPPLLQGIVPGRIRQPVYLVVYVGLGCNCKQIGIEVEFNCYKV
jgi:hypothetical protein